MSVVDSFKCCSLKAKHFCSHFQLNPSVTNSGWEVVEFILAASIMSPKCYLPGNSVVSLGEDPFSVIRVKMPYFGKEKVIERIIK